MKAENKNSERRDKARWTEIVPIKITENIAGTEHEARMLNYSKNGIYFESDSLIEEGTEIYIAIQNAASDLDGSDYSCLSAKIAWRKDLKEDAFFYFGYGAFFTSNKTEEIGNHDTKSGENKRKHIRESFKKAILLSNEGNVYKGETADISSTGIFIKSEKKFKPEDEIAFIIPGTKRRSVILRGKVVWSNRNGFGLKFSRQKTG